MLSINHTKWIFNITILGILLYLFFVLSDIHNQLITSLASTHTLYNKLVPMSFMFYFRMGLIGFNLMISLIYGLLYLSNTQNRVLLWFMLFTLFFGLGHLGLFFPLHNNNSNNLAILFILSQVGLTICSMMSLLIVLELTKKKIKSYHILHIWSIFIVNLLYMVVYFLDVAPIYKNLFYFIHTFLISMIATECIVLVFRAYIKKIINFILVVAVLVVCLCASIYLFPAHLAKHWMADLSVFFMPFSVAIIITFLFADSYLELQKKTTEVQRLSLEKQIILEKQAKLLTQQVNKKTSELKVLNDTKDKIFSIISHDLRSPIYSIIGTLELIENETLSKEENIFFIKNLKQEVSKTYEVLDNLLYWSMSQMKQFRINQTTFELVYAVSASVELFKELIRKKNIELCINIPETLTVCADENHIRCVIRNLLSNAIKFTPNNGKISVSATKKQDYVELEIKDSGVGIKENQLTNLFNLPTINKSTNGELGVGLGLNLCKELIEQNGGCISVTSEYQKGTSFVVKILTKKRA